MLKMKLMEKRSIRMGHAKGNAHGRVAEQWEKIRDLLMSTLPLKAVSRLWGRFNELPIPYYLLVPGFKLYSWVFRVK